MTSEVTWAPLQRLRSYEQVIAAIEQRILAGQLHVGDRLPPERQLAELLGVSRAAVREALRALEALGILVAQTGSGADAGSTLVEQPSEAMTMLLRLHLALSNFTVDDVVATRIMLEGQAARAAAERRGTADLSEVERCLEAMEPLDLTTQEFNNLDTQFHVAIAVASDNRLTAHLMQSLRDTMREHMMRAFEGLERPDEVKADLRTQHRVIFELVRDGDGEGAARAIEAHIGDFYAEHGR
ncbi:MAG: FadR/GntR family transcriptional regulator [Streptosporangiales bacterium]